MGLRYRYLQSRHPLEHISLGISPRRFHKFRYHELNRLTDSYIKTLTNPNNVSKQDLVNQNDQKTENFSEFES